MSLLIRNPRRSTIGYTIQNKNHNSRANKKQFLLDKMYPKSIYKFSALYKLMYAQCILKEPLKIVIYFYVMRIPNRGYNLGLVFLAKVEKQDFQPLQTKRHDAMPCHNLVQKARTTASSAHHHLPFHTSCLS